MCSKGKCSQNGCFKNKDCAEFETCVNGECLSEACRLNSDCEQGLVCRNDQCQNCVEIRECPIVRLIPTELPLFGTYAYIPTCNCNNFRDFHVKMENVRVISANPMEIARVTKYVWKMSVEILNVQEIDSAKG